MRPLVSTDLRNFGELPALDLGHTVHESGVQDMQTRRLQACERQTVELAIGLLNQVITEVNESLNDALWDLCAQPQTTAPSTWVSLPPGSDTPAYETIPCPPPESSVSATVLRTHHLPRDLMDLVMAAAGVEVFEAVDAMLAGQS